MVASFIHSDYQIPEITRKLTLEGEARLLLLSEAFSRSSKVLEGRTKLAKLDFLLRYPSYCARALQIRRPGLVDAMEGPEPDLESRMVRYPVRTMGSGVLRVARTVDR